MVISNSHLQGIPLYHYTKKVHGVQLVGNKYIFAYLLHTVCTICSSHCEFHDLVFN